jgi:hypothetical protein
VAEVARLMRGRLLLNLALLLCAVLLGVWIYRDAGHGGDRLSTLAPDAVRRIEIERRDGQAVAFARTDAGWRMLAPRELPASAYHLDLLLRFLRLPVDARYPRREVDLAAAGLSRPTLTVRFDDARYVFGGLDPLGRRRYLLHAGDVLLVREGVSAILASPWWNFIDRRLLADGEPSGLRFADGRRLALDQAPAVRARWQQASASLVRPLPAGARGAPFVLELRSGERIRWQWVGGEQPRLLRPDLGLAYEVSADQLDALLGPAAARPQ